MDEINQFKFINNKTIDDSEDKPNFIDNNNNNLDNLDKDPENLNELWLVIDIRNFYKNPDQPLLINDKVYYLSVYQINKLKMLYNKVNPETPSGIKYQQDLEYYKSIATEKLKI